MHHFTANNKKFYRQIPESNPPGGRTLSFLLAGLSCLGTALRMSSGTKDMWQSFGITLLTPPDDSVHIIQYR